MSFYWNKARFMRDFQTGRSGALQSLWVEVDDDISAFASSPCAWRVRFVRMRWLSKWWTFMVGGMFVKVAGDKLKWIRVHQHWCSGMPTELTQRKLQACTRCGRDSHSIQQCYAKTTVAGRILDDSESDSSDSSETCFLCGRTSHWAKDCYAQITVHGNLLNKWHKNSIISLIADSVYLKEDN